MLVNAGVYYNKQFNTLLISVSNEEHNKIENNDEIVVMKKDNEIVAVNILNVDIPISKAFINSQDKTVLDYVNNKLKKIISVNIESCFVIGKIISCSPITDTHLSDCLVDIANEKLKIVCGAKNAQINLLTAVAKIGSWMPSGLLIESSKLRGYESHGMLCSAKELQIDQFTNDGIIEFPQDFENKIGCDLWEAIKWKK